MERLNFDTETKYSGLEAAVHIGRYAIARGLCAGRRVLDVACGEGYGTSFLVGWGARHVTGVDVSSDAIGNAKRHFASDRAEFLEGDAEQVATLLQGQSFDLIVSLETIEHLKDPGRFLVGLEALLAPNGVIIISCPNDWWYYPTEAERNPYHIHKYRFSEFQHLSESVLGPATYWGLGSALAGFYNFPVRDSPRTEQDDSQIRMMDAREIQNCHVVPANADDGPKAHDCSYFFGAWGAVGTPAFGAAILPISMDVFRTGIYAGSGKPLPADLLQRLSHAEDDVKRMHAQISVVTSELETKERQLREAKLHLTAVTCENQALKENVKVLQATFASNVGTDMLYQVRERWALDWNSIGIAAWRYLRLRDLVPSSVRYHLGRLVRIVRGIRNR